MFKRILVPVDGSSYAEKTLAYLPRFLAHTQTEVVLLSVLETMRYAANAYEYAPTLLDDLRAEYTDYLQDWCERLHKQGYPCVLRLLEGDAAEQILQVAQQTQADLIAMSTHGRAGMARWALGSVAERVIHGTTLPVLLVREQTIMPHQKLQRILVPLDGSTLAEQALPHAQALAAETQAEVQLLHVIATNDLEYKFERAFSADPMYDDVTTKAMAYLKSVAAPLEAKGVTCQTTVLCGDPASLICALVNEALIDLIVISTHGRTGFQRWMYGSIANKVLRQASCPLLVIRGAQPEQPKTGSRAHAPLPV